MAGTPCVRRHIVVASEPSSTEGHWKLLKSNTLLLVTGDELQSQNVPWMPLRLRFWASLCLCRW
jgi:hypothetical protein